MARVYLETSFVSACVSTRTDAASIYRRQASLDWMATQAPGHDLFVSAEVQLELDSPTYPQRTAALVYIQPFQFLALTNEVLGLASLLVQEKVMPGPARGDPIHVAAACVHRMDYLLSWNVRHLANPNKIAHLQAVAMRVGLMPPRILTPDLLWEKP